jgi:hypothetical protein
MGVCAFSVRSLALYGPGTNGSSFSYQKDWTPMHLSVTNGYFEIVGLLLERGADIHAMNDG